MAVLTSTGINFSDATSLNSLYGIIPQSSLTIFYETNAPTGWTQNATHNNKAFRVKTTAGGASAGSITFTQAFNTPKPFSGPSITNGQIQGANIGVGALGTHGHPSPAATAVQWTHGHPYTRAAEAPNRRQNQGVNPSLAITQNGYNNANSGPEGAHGHNANVGNSGVPVSPHSHPYPQKTGTFSVGVNFAVQYVDIIICSFN